MSNEFKVPAKPWGEAEISLMMANKNKLDNETRAELGLDSVVESTPSEEPAVEDETTVEETEAEVETPEEEVETTEEETVDNIDENNA